MLATLCVRQLADVVLFYEIPPESRLERPDHSFSHSLPHRNCRLESLDSLVLVVNSEERRRIRGVVTLLLQGSTQI